MADYIPFAESIKTVQTTDITPYNPQEFIIQTNKYVVHTHCYVCGKGDGYGYWKHHCCNTVPISDSNLTLGVLLIFYSLYKYFKK